MPTVIYPGEEDFRRGRDRGPQRGSDRRGPRLGIGLIAALLIGLLIGARSIAGFFLELAWWREIGQEETWYALLGYGFLPSLGAGLLFAVVLWTTHVAAVKGAGGSLGTYRGYTRITAAMILIGSLLLGAITIDSWTVVRYLGAQGAAAGDVWRDPVFQKALPFYFFDLPFYSMLLRALVALSLATIIVYWIFARGWKLRSRLREFAGQGGGDIDIQELGFKELLESRLIRIAGFIGLLALAARTYLSRYTLLTEDHVFMVGMDWVAETISLPMLWFSIAVTVAAGVLLLSGRFRIPLLLLAAAIALPPLIERVVSFSYVRPNEISIQKPYIVRHIAGTRAAYGLDKRTREVEFPARINAPFDAARHASLLSNVRLWDWQAFHDTVTQLQALRQYYVFNDSDVDRYRLPGPDGTPRLQQVLLAPRELDVRQLPDARTRWINPHFIYTHGYGVVMAEANRITADGSPQLLIQNAPPEVKTAGLKLTRPEIYYGERVHEPVFVRTGQPEFNYPAGSENVHTEYSGKGGFPVGSLPMRIAAAVREGDWNILLTTYLTAQSRMMVRRDVRQRVEAAMSFVDWDTDPYLVVTAEGRLVWLLDGYTSSSSHPYARRLRTQQFGVINYVRNSVKATIDAYDGSMNFYVFDEADPIVRSYRQLFPRLFQPASAMPRDLREHTRYPEVLFRLQAEIYRTFHMRDPEAFYNKEDQWDIARNSSTQEGQTNTATPTYLISRLEDSTEPEFLLMIPFTPRNKDNMIGLMVARCDGDRLGEIVFLQLSKQELIFGPMQIKARINQDQNIAKDLTLWNQQGSKVIRGQMLVLPIDKTFLYVEPIYLQASQAPMPQLKKIALASGSQIAYADTYEQALAQLGASMPEQPPAPASAPSAATPASAPAAGPQTDPRVAEARSRLARYRELMAQGKFAEAGRELEALQALLK